MPILLTDSNPPIQNPHPTPLSRLRSIASSTAAIARNATASLTGLFYARPNRHVSDADAEALLVVNQQEDNQNSNIEMFSILENYRPNTQISSHITRSNPGRENLQQTMQQAISNIRIGQLIRSIQDQIRSRPSEQQPQPSNADAIHVLLRMHARSLDIDSDSYTSTTAGSNSNRPFSDRRDESDQPSEPEQQPCCFKIMQCFLSVTSILTTFASRFAPSCSRS